MVTASAVDSLIADPGRTQRQALELLEGSWRAGLEGLDDDALLACLRVIRKRVNSKKLRTRRDALIGALRRDGCEGEAPLPKPTRPAVPQLDWALARSSSGAEQRARARARAEADMRLELEVAIARNPGDNAAYAVYRDWLETRGRVVDGRLPLGPLVEADDMLSQLEWHLGFLRRARLSYSYARFNGERPPLSIEDALGALLDEPGPGRALEALTIGIALHDDNDYAGVCAVIGARPRPTLRQLEIGDFDYEECELNWSSINATAPMWPALAWLESLWLRAGSMVLDGLELPRLRRLATVTGGMNADALRVIGGAHWPKLERLELQVGASSEGAATEVDPLVPLLMEPEARCPELVHLGVTNCEFSDELCELLPRAPLLPQLRSLDLSMGTLSMAGVEALAREAERFAHLESINVDDNYLPDAAREPLQRLGARIEFGEQRADEGNRYASAYE